MHLSKSRLKKKGPKPQMSAGRGRGPKEQQAPRTSLLRNSPKELLSPLHTSSRSRHPSSRPQGLPASV